MDKKKRWCLLLVLYLCIPVSKAAAGDFDLLTKDIRVSIVYDRSGPVLDSITASLLQQDIYRVSGYLPEISNDISKVRGNVIVLGNVHSALLSSLAGNRSALKDKLTGKWECYSLSMLTKPRKNLNKVLLIAGSDTRGTAYGVFSISEKIGVSPWYWWADVRPEQKKELSIKIEDFISEPPSVKYRGIFLNDEDWGLQPWAAKTFEPETGDIGPKTYAKIFELLLRLKANLIWPAMHPSTKAFYSYAGNKKVAENYAIVVGSSHAEPMLRNNVGEWTASMGPFNYITNKNRVYSYWEERIKESKTNDAIYTLGMRGVHDSGMEGVKNVKEAVPLLEQIIADQRAMLGKYLGKNASAIPQVFTVYKEVLEIYDSNLKLPDDVTIVWPDDNYGYIQRLNNEAEKSRRGGSGIYYHASYWGRPHDYLWLSSTQPALIREEMMKAYETKADRLWVLNVGDIKPAEYTIQFFMDMAYRAAPFKDSKYVGQHLSAWVSGIFGDSEAEKISPVLSAYYNLAFERKPEFMGWSQTEPTTKTRYSEYNHFYYGDEAQRRIDSYDSLEQQVKRLRPQIKSKDADAFYQLVYYPVTGASLMNKKFLYHDKSFLYARQNRLSAAEFSARAKESYNGIVKETEYYNTELAGGKWKLMMSMQPRSLPVFNEPVAPEVKPVQEAGWDIAPEGFVTKDSSLVTAKGGILALPVFTRMAGKKYFIDIFLCSTETLDWTAVPGAAWINLSAEKGRLSNESGKRQQRIWVSIDWEKVPAKAIPDAKIVINGSGKNIPVQVRISDAVPAAAAGRNMFMEDNGYLSIFAASYSRKQDGAKSLWETADGLGITGKSVQALSQQPGDYKVPETSAIKGSAVLEYDFFTTTAGAPLINIFTLPTHPVNNLYNMRYAVSLDDGPVKVLDFKTVGRSAEWKENVLSNRAQRQLSGQPVEAGKHTLKIYMLDPGVVLQYITIDMGGLKNAYSTIPETRVNAGK